MRLDPENASRLNTLAWHLAIAPAQGTRNGAQAVVHAQKAVKLMPDSAPHRDTLAAAYAESGQFENAVEEQRRAIRLLGNAASNETISGYEDRLNLYLTGQPYHEEPPPP